MNSGIVNNLNLDTSVVVSDIQSNFPRVKSKRIQQLEKLDPSRQIITKLINIFFQEITGRIPEMKNYCQANDFEKLSQTLHRFKSTTYNLGASRAVELTAAIESLILKKQSPQDLLFLITALEEECLKAHKALLAL